MSCIVSLFQWYDMYVPLPSNWFCPAPSLSSNGCALPLQLGKADMITVSKKIDISMCFFNTLDQPVIKVSMWCRDKNMIQIILLLLEHLRTCTQFQGFIWYSMTFQVTMSWVHKYFAWVTSLRKIQTLWSTAFVGFTVYFLVACEGILYEMFMCDRRDNSF